MSRHSTRKAIKHMLHESGQVAGSTYGIPHEGNIYAQILPDVDVSICNQNPHRKLPDSAGLVSGFDNAGNFQGVIPQGSTHGYWTTSNIADVLIPEDHAGSTTERYVARILFVFDLNKAGITAGDKLVDAQFRFIYYKSNTIKGSNTFNWDFHRVHPGTTNSGISGAMLNVGGGRVTENATWYEYDHSGTGVTGHAHEGVGYRGFESTTGPTHGVNRWDNQGMGFTGSTAEHRGDNFGGTGQWLDYSDGVTGSNQSVLYSVPLYPEFTASRATAIAGEAVKLDFTQAVEDARANYDNYLRFMIKLRDDHIPSGGVNRHQFIAIVSSEADPDKLETDASTITDYAPTLHITYSR